MDVEAVLDPPLGSNEFEFPHKSLFTVRQVANLRKKSSAIKKFLRTQISKIIGYSIFLDAFFQRIAGSWKKNTIPLAKNVHLSLRLTTAASVAAYTVDAVIKKIHGSETTTLVISKETIEDMKKKIYLEDSIVLINGATKTTENETRVRLLDMLYANFLWNMLSSKDVIRASKENRAGMDFGFCHIHILISNYKDITNINKFAGVYSRKSSQKNMDGVHVMNLDEYARTLEYFGLVFILENDLWIHLIKFFLIYIT